MRSIPAFAGCFTLLVLAGCASGPRGLQSPDPLGNSAGPIGFRRVVIDAGHGGSDSGATSRFAALPEKDLALDTAQRVNRLLGGRFHVAMNRDRDTFVDLDQRVVMANQSGDVLVSIHYNSGGGDLHGPEVYYWRPDSHGLATRLYGSLTSVYGGNVQSRGLVRRRLRLTRNPRIPSVLVECGYLSNGTEAHRVADAHFRQLIAESIARAVTTQAAIGDRGTGALPPPLNEPPSRGTDKRQ